MKGTFLIVPSTVLTSEASYKDVLKFCTTEHLFKMKYWRIFEFIFGAKNSFKSKSMEK